MVVPPIGNSVWSPQHQPIGVRAILYGSNLKHLEEVFALPRQPDCMGLKQYAKTAKLGFCSCQTRVWQLPNSGLAAVKLGFGVWQLPNWGLAAA